jgi:hypothetical protein
VIDSVLKGNYMVKSQWRRELINSHSNKSESLPMLSEKDVNLDEVTNDTTQL